VSYPRLSGRRGQIRCSSNAAPGLGGDSPRSGVLSGGGRFSALVGRRSGSTFAWRPAVARCERRCRRVWGAGPGADGRGPHPDEALACRPYRHSPRMPARWCSRGEAWVPVAGASSGAGGVHDASALLSASVSPTAPSPSIACQYAGLRGTERGGRGIHYPRPPALSRGAVRSEDSFAVLRTDRSCRTIQHPDGMRGAVEASAALVRSHGKGGV
jgi:hypothetical protein